MYEPQPQKQLFDMLSCCCWGNPLGNSNYHFLGIKQKFFICCGFYIFKKHYDIFNWLLDIYQQMLMPTNGNRIFSWIIRLNEATVILYNTTALQITDFISCILKLRTTAINFFPCCSVSSYFILILDCLCQQVCLQHVHL